VPAAARPAARRALLAPALLAAVVLAGGCSRFSERDERALAELERLAFVPAGQCVFRALSGPPLTCSNEAPLLVDAYEVRRAEWRRWYAGEIERDALHADEIARWDAALDQRPATYMTLDEARRFAASRGLRLLTAREWLRVAAGAGAQPLSWPWGQNIASVANTLELGIGHALAVGTFEQGKSPLGVYDLLGNAWEWVEQPILRPYTSSEAGLEWAMGGSYLSKKRRLWEIVSVVEPDPGSGRSFDRQRWWFHAQERDPRARSIDVGLRCATDAEQYLWTHVAECGSSRAAEERLRALGRRWGRSAAPLLEALSLRRGAPAGLMWLLGGARQ
jgi:hypothetical protein